MGEEDLRRWQNSVDTHILAIENKLDAMRKELQESIQGFYGNTRNTHQRLFDRIDAIEEDIRGIKVELARSSPIIEAAQKHMATDVPVDVARDKAIARAVVYIMGLCASGFIGWFFRSLG